MRYKYRSIAVGGTFDHVHRGHVALLKRAFECGKVVYIGLTTDEFVRQSAKKIVNNYEQRRKNLIEYIEANYPSREYYITRLEKQFGPGIFTPDIEAIAVSDETFPSVADANTKRRSIGLPDLKIEVVSLILADDGKRISSTRIRAGEIDSEGHLIKKSQ